MIIQIFLIAVNAALGALGLWLVPPRQRYFLNPVNSFWIVFLYFSVLQPATNLESYNTRFGIDNVTLALIAFGTSASFLYLGTRVSLGRRLSYFIPSIQKASHVRLNQLAVAMLLMGVGMTLVLIDAYGGWNAYFLRSNLRLLEVEVSHYLTLGPRIATFAVMIGLTINAYYRRPFGGVIYATLATLLLLWYVYHGSRSSVILMAVILVGAMYAPRMRSPNAIVMLSAGLMLSLTIGFIGAYRSIFSGPEFFTQMVPLSELLKNSLGFLLRSESTGLSEVSLNEDFGMAAAVVAHVPASVNYDYGYMFLQLFTQWIPRGIWPGKIYPDGQAWDLLHRAAQTSLYINGAGYLAGPAPTIVGKYYYAFGFPGVAVGSFLSGVMLKAIWSYTLRLPANIRPIFMIATAPIGFMEANNPSLWLAFWLPTAGVTLALVLLVTRTGRTRKEAST